MNQRLSGIGMTSERTRARMVERLRTQGILDETVLSVMQSVPRHIFVDEALESRAYEDSALPIGHGQTISQPYVVARMAELLRQGVNLARGGGKVLEVGTGCGYQAAVLARLFADVYSVERIGELLSRARRATRELRALNLRFKHADGILGLPEAALFDGIIVAAAAMQVPQALLEQLAVGGRLVIPVGGKEQVVRVIDRSAEGYTEHMLDAVRFVPLLSGTQ
jgi:protein-L-isoaspartate(D-aspartate) O-methyltransferase